MTFPGLVLSASIAVLYSGKYCRYSAACEHEPGGKRLCMVWKPYPAVHGGYLVLGGLGMSINTSARGRVLSYWWSFSLQLQITNGTTTQEKFGKSCERRCMWKGTFSMPGHWET